MERTEIIEFEYPERPAGMETWANDGYLIGDKVVWNVFSGDWETRTPHPGLTLAIVDANESKKPTFVDDSRCIPGGPSFVTDNGDYYVHGGGFFGYFYAYGEIPEGIRTCALRVNAGETEFDPDYLLDYEEVTGSPVNTPWIHVSGDHYFTRAWDPEVPLPESEDDFWAGGGLRPRLVDLSAGTSEPYPDLEGLLDIDGVTRIVDGVSYFQASETGYFEGGNTDVVELGVDGTQVKFRLVGGFLLGLERLR
mgnify:FL=1